MTAAPGTTRRAGGDWIVVGGIAFLAVAAFYSLFDLFASRGMLFTVNLLGRVVFRGLRDPTILQYPVEIDRAAVAGYTLVHFVLSLAIGFVVTRLIGDAEAHPNRARLMLAVIVGGFIATILLVGGLTESIRPLLPWWSIVVANSAAVLLAAGYLMRRRPGVAGRMLAA